MTEYIILVAAAIVIEEDRVLLGRRGQNVPLNGCWEFPGGKIEYWETPQECLERELFEELGVASKAGAIIAESDYQYAEGAIKLLALLTVIADHNFTLTVHDKIEWVPVTSLLEYKLAPADIAIAKKIMEMVC